MGRMNNWVRGALSWMMLSTAIKSIKSEDLIAKIKSMTEEQKISLLNDRLRYVKKRMASLTKPFSDREQYRWKKVEESLRQQSF